MKLTTRTANLSKGYQQLQAYVTLSLNHKSTVMAVYIRC